MDLPEANKKKKKKKKKKKNSKKNFIVKKSLNKKLPDFFFTFQGLIHEMNLIALGSLKIYKATQKLFLMC